MREILRAVQGKLEAGDVVVLSEKAISVAEGRVVDEACIKPNFTAKLLARVWMRIIWGYLLAPLCHLSQATMSRLRSYPLREGAAHKQLALSHAGLLQALRHGSEGGIDVSNLPYALAALPLEDAHRTAENILRFLSRSGAAELTVLIVDSDKTYSWCGTHISPRSSSIPGIVSLGVLAYVLGRAFRLRARSTPIAQGGRQLSVEEALQAAALANRARGSGSGRTAWDMAERFGVGLTDVTWEFLERVRHRPIVVVRKVSG